MKYFITLILLMLPALAEAHHTGASSSSRGSFYQQSQTKPSSRAYFYYSLGLADDSIAEIHSWTVGGEWAMTRRISLLGILPVSFIDHHFQANKTGLGDIVIGSKFLLWDKEEHFVFATAALQLPTGDENSGIGSGSVIQNIDFFAGINVKEWTLFGVPGISFAYDSPHEPVLAIAVGAATPKWKEHFYFSLAAKARIFMASTDFTDGSWKLFLEPQINWDIDEENRWTLSAGGNICIMDELAAKRTLTRTDNALLSDIGGSTTITLNHSF